MPVPYHTIARVAATSLVEQLRIARVALDKAASLADTLDWCNYPDERAPKPKPVEPGWAEVTR